jgi:hypothetical protein
MGDGVKLPDGTTFCGGKDVVKDLNIWFGDVFSATYLQARTLQTETKEDACPLFQLGDGKQKTTDLAAAYGIVGRIHDPNYKVPENWDMYLDSLHNVPSNDPGGLDGYDLIVKARAEGLGKNIPMWTQPHIPCEGDPARVMVTEETMDHHKPNDPQVYLVFSVPYTAFGFGWDDSTYKSRNKT